LQSQSCISPKADWVGKVEDTCRHFSNDITRQWYFMHPSKSPAKGYAAGRQLWLGNTTFVTRQTTNEEGLMFASKVDMGYA
jgi:hypothetical protein